MKNSFLVLFVSVLMSGNLIGQNYLNGSELWNEQGGIYGIATGELENWYRTYRIAGDTLINGLSYHKIVYDGVDSTFAGFPFSLISTAVHQNEYIAAVREEAKRFYKVMYYQTQESVLHDFDLEIGDTSFYGSEKFIVDSIDYVDVGGGEMRKVFFTENPYNPRLFEGIGLTTGLFGIPTTAIEAGNLLNCFSRNGIITPVNVMSGFCSLENTPVEEVVSENPIHLYPNPVNSLLRIDLKMEAPLSLTVFDVTGKIIGHWEENIPTSIDVGSWSNGMYLMAVATQNGGYIQKWMKE